MKGEKMPDIALQEVAEGEIYVSEDGRTSCKEHLPISATYGADGWAIKTQAAHARELTVIRKAYPGVYDDPEFSELACETCNA